MGISEGSNGCVNSPRAADHLDFIFLATFQLALYARKWLTAWQWPELSLPQCLPGAAVIVADAACTRLKQRCFDLFKVRGRHIKSNAVHHRENKRGMKENSRMQDNAMFLLIAANYHIRIVAISKQCPDLAGSGVHDMLLNARSAYISLCIILCEERVAQGTNNRAHTGCTVFQYAGLMGLMCLSGRKPGQIAIEVLTGLCPCAFCQYV